MAKTTKFDFYFFLAAPPDTHSGECGKSTTKFGGNSEKDAPTGKEENKSSGKYLARRHHALQTKVNLLQLALCLWRTGTCNSFAVLLLSFSTKQWSSFPDQNDHAWSNTSWCNQKFNKKFFVINICVVSMLCLLCLTQVLWYSHDHYLHRKL